ncbi:hypothetical protein BRARA_B01585 [Brassica rapa]|uniref:Uncharacterized protein n=1 Tax=Brassica campestris TaxID=3711 RepID=A0A398AC96_BRACM|nr:hypothetical protein BRARA_B01585 [Brassica rapa]
MLLLHSPDCCPSSLSSDQDHLHRFLLPLPFHYFQPKPKVSRLTGKPTTVICCVALHGRLCIVLAGPSLREALR